ncbi:hypothetical protein [Phaeovulum veldkampii]|uniref:hypothetical protein n=1 Tax=Phaeovulum veldkampii TaxID=33049 RepID=UPI00105E4B51|nr:hypothetical protein [Phaeovulum veldkampii]
MTIAAFFISQKQKLKKTCSRHARWQIPFQRKVLFQSHPPLTWDSEQTISATEFSGKTVIRIPLFSSIIQHVTAQL